MSTAAAIWDALLSLAVRVAGIPVLHPTTGKPAQARELDFSAAFTVAYDASRRKFTVALNTTDGFTLTDATHGALGWSTTGALDADLHHAIAQEDPEGHPGFLSTANANNLQWYVGQASPTGIGTFGIGAVTTSMLYGTTSSGLQWRGNAGHTTRAAPRWRLEDVGIVLYNGAFVVAADGGTLDLPDGTNAPHPYQLGEGMSARVINAGVANVTILCPAGGQIGGGGVGVDYVVSAGQMISIEPGPDDTTWAVTSWTL